MRHAFLLPVAGLLAAAFAFTGAPRTAPPPGTIRINDTLFMDKHEVPNMSWREFEFWSYRNNGADTGILPDTARFGDLGLDISGALTRQYYRKPSFNDFPMVGISHAQAEAFCRWRSARVNELIASGKAPKDWKFKKVQYRLPTEAEWELAAAGGLDKSKYPYGFRNLLDPKKGIMVWALYPARRPGDRPLMTATNNRYPNGYGLYHMCGNVAEMIAEPGIAKGGHFNLPVDSCKLESRLPYDRAEAWLGFRCVATVTY